MKNQKIQGLRGITALVVFVSHVVLEGTLLNGINKTPLGVFASGSAGVMMFFFLSGYFAYKEKHQLQDILKSIWGKAKRLYLPYILSLFIGMAGYYLISYSTRFDPYFGVTLAHSWEQDFTVLDFIIQCLMVVKQTDAAVLNPPVWTMIIEMRMVFLLPIMYLPFYLFSFMEKKRFTAVYAAVVMIGCFIMNSILKVSLFHWISAFFMGGILHHLIWKGHLKIAEEGKGLPKGYTYLLVVLSIVLIGIGRQYTIPGINEDFIYAISAMGCAILCWLILCNANGLNGLANRYLVYMGDISYYFYLSQWIVLAALRPVVVWMVERKGTGYMPAYLTFVVLSFVGALLMSAGFQKIMNWLLRKKQ